MRKQATYESDEADPATELVVRSTPSERCARPPFGKRTSAQCVEPVENAQSAEVFCVRVPSVRSPYSLVVVGNTHSALLVDTAVTVRNGHSEPSEGYQWFRLKNFRMLF